MTQQALSLLLEQARKELEELRAENAELQWLLDNEEEALMMEELAYWPGMEVPMEIYTLDIH
jgi:hypothetical protein